MTFRVLKFGGTSMGTAQMIQTSARIVQSQLTNGLQIWCVVSAMSGVTNSLYRMIESTRLGNKEEVSTILEDLHKKHYSALEEIVGIDEAHTAWEEFFAPRFHNLSTIAEGLTLLRDVSPKYQARIVYFGEIFSSLLIVECFRQLGISALQILSRDIIRTDNNYLNGFVDMDMTKQLCQEQLTEVSEKQVLVVTGFAGGSSSSDTVLLDRGGSDYVATIVGASIGADRVEIWTDVDGVYSADPRKVTSPKHWSQIDYSVAAELALSGAKVLHPKTISPVQAEHIPVIIKNTFSPESEGTEISDIQQKGPIGINVTPGQTLFHFSDPSMCGAVGFIYHVLGVFFRHEVSIDALSTSEISFTCSVGGQDVNGSLITECQTLGNLTVFPNLAKISIVGQDFSNLHILSEHIHEHLSGHTVYLLCQNASFTNITIFVEEDEATEILQKLHESIFNTFSLG